ncbi:unnamed protein product [Phaeothamnion confervicola]
MELQCDGNVAAVSPTQSARLSVDSLRDGVGASTDREHGATTASSDSAGAKRSAAEASNGSGEPAARKRFAPGAPLSAARTMSLNRAKHNDRDLIIKGKDFRDKIHGNVKLQDVIARLVDTPEFQRLAGLKQLGASAYVYRGAVHTRFEHSVGVAHLAEKLCLVLKEHQPELGISDRDVMCVKIAGLCHDLGHGPFSHCWDGLFMRRFGLSWRHEDGSVAMLRHLLAANGIDLFADYGLDATDLLFVEEQILGTAPEKRRGRPDKEYLYEIVNNVWSGLDVDKLDYLQRDASDAGIAGDKIDSDRCIGLARVAWADDGRGGRRRTIAYPEKMVFEVLDVFSMRYRLHRVRHWRQGKRKDKCECDRARERKRLTRDFAAMIFSLLHFSSCFLPLG